MREVLFHPEAVIEMNAAASWYEEKQASLGKRFLASVQDVIQRIRNTPYLYPEVCSEIRRGLTRTFPFGVVYKADNETIQVYAVMHIRGEPDYWKNRL